MSVKQQQSCRSAIAYHPYRIYLEPPCAYCGGGEQEAAYPEPPGVQLQRAEILRFHQQQSGGTEQTHHGWAETGEDALHRRCVHVFHEQPGYHNHQYQRRKHEGKRCRHAAENGHPVAVTGVVNSRVTAVCGRVDAYRAGCHLAYRHYVGELSDGQPPVMMHHFALNQRQHAVTAAETEQTYLEECYE